MRSQVVPFLNFDFISLSSALRGSEHFGSFFCFVFSSPSVRVVAVLARARNDLPMPCLHSSSLGFEQYRRQRPLPRSSSFLLSHSAYHGAWLMLVQFGNLLASFHPGGVESWRLCLPPFRKRSRIAPSKGGKETFLAAAMARERC